MEASNIKAMREALSRILGIADHLQTRFVIPRLASEEILELKQIAESALSAPPRNCDVGTGDEQEDRFEKFCDAHKYVGDDGANICSQDCPCYNNLDCGVRWAQMPYEEGGEK